MHKKLRVLVGITCLVLALGTARASHAILAAVSESAPGIVLVDPATGFPFWYQDFGFAPNQPSFQLGLCLSQTANANGFLCGLLPEPGFDPALPIVFPNPLAVPPVPGNFPTEAFYWGATAATDLSTGGSALLVLALEAAFATGDVIAGDQITFARLRLRIDAPVAGTYVVTHPYGQETFNVTAPGTRSINVTRDIGIATCPIFAGALNASHAGPWLIRDPGRDGFQDTDLIVIGAETFIGDPGLLEPVTGSPVGTNFFRVEQTSGAGAPRVLGETDLFSVLGKIFSATPPPPPPPGTPVAVADTISTAFNTPVTISVLGNDTFVAPVTVNLAAGGPVAGLAVVNPDNSVTYTPNLNFAGTDVFNYTFTQGSMASNVASVSVTVNPSLTEVITVTSIAFSTNAAATAGRWDIRGTSSVPAPNRITAHLGTATGPIIGFDTVSAAGRWRINVRGSRFLASPGDTVTLQSTGGTTTVVTVP
jgi:hypothetical protein